MKPLSSRPPPHNTHTRRRTACVTSTAGGSGSGAGGGDSNGGGGGGHRKDNSAGVDAGGSRGGRGCSNGAVIDRSSFPQWMKTLEDRWQKLHSKINCPAAHGAGARFNWVARRLLSQRLARIAKNTTNNNNSNNNNHVNNARCNSTAPNTTTYKHSLGSEEGDFGYDVIDNVFDEVGERLRPVTAVHTDGELVSVSEFNLYSRPQSTDFGGPYTQTALRSHASTRDGALEGNNNSSVSLAPAPDLARPDILPGQDGGANTNHNPRLVSATVHTADNSAGGVPADRSVVAGVDVDTDGGGGGGGDVDGGVDTEGRSRVWADHCEMNGTSTRGVRTLNPLTGGPMVRTAKTGVSHISHITTKSCPAALNAQASSSTGERNPWGRGRPGGRGRGNGPGMRVFAHMSVEARHAISETLREMGADNDKNGDDSDDDNESDVTLPSLPDEPRQIDSDYATQPLQSIVSKTDNHTINSNNNHRRGGRQGDATSSVNATVRGGRSPRYSKTKKFSSQTNLRTHPRNFKTNATEEEDVKSNAADNGEDLDLLSMASVGSLSSGASSPGGARREAGERTRLPAITSRTEPHVLPPRADHIRHVNYRIQGVGSYRVAREATFEITAPDFDIRYRDVITCQRGDRETPPPDIFDRSVSKVKEWLTKYYTPR